MDLWSKKVWGIITQVTLILLSSHEATRGGESSEIFILGVCMDQMWGCGSAAHHFTLSEKVLQMIQVFSRSLQKLLVVHVVN